MRPGSTTVSASSRAAAVRHCRVIRRLRATLDWSYELLTEPERGVLRRLAIFAGGFSLQAATRPWRGRRIAESDVLDCVSNLVAKSLVTADAGGTMVRYRLLETTRAYALEKLVESGEFEATARRHAGYYLDVFERRRGRGGDAANRRMAGRLWLRGSTTSARRWTGLFRRVAIRRSGSPSRSPAVPLWIQLSLMEECRGARRTSTRQYRPRIEPSTTPRDAALCGTGRITDVHERTGARDWCRVDSGPRTRRSSWRYDGSAIGPLGPVVLSIDKRRASDRTGAYPKVLQPRCERDGPGKFARWRPHDGDLVALFGRPGQRARSHRAHARSFDAVHRPGTTVSLSI